MEKQYGDLLDQTQEKQSSSVGSRTKDSSKIYSKNSKPSQTSPEDQYTVEPETDEDLDQEYREELDYHSND